LSLFFAGFARKLPAARGGVKPGSAPAQVAQVARVARRRKKQADSPCFSLTADYTLHITAQRRLEMSAYLSSAGRHAYQEAAHAATQGLDFQSMQKTVSPIYIKTFSELHSPEAWDKFCASMAPQSPAPKSTEKHLRVRIITGAAEHYGSALTDLEGGLALFFQGNPDIDLVSVSVGAWEPPRAKGFNGIVPATIIFWEK